MTDEIPRYAQARVTLEDIPRIALESGRTEDELRAMLMASDLHLKPLNVRYQIKTPMPVKRERRKWRKR